MPITTIDDMFICDVCCTIVRLLNDADLSQDDRANIHAIGHAHHAGTASAKDFQDLLKYSNKYPIEPHPL